jgi:peptidoglycan/LPS O-acetylase OafA/YrhL
VSSQKKHVPRKVGPSIHWTRAAEDANGPRAAEQQLIGAPAPREPTLIVRAFDIAENTQKLMLPDSGPTACLNGMRVLSMLWIVLGHSFLMAASTVGYSNPLEILDPEYGMKTGWFFAFVCSAQSGVDTFFFMSGYLLVLASRSLLQAAPSVMKGVSKLLQALVYRYLRLTPALAFVLFCYIQLAFQLGSGPFFPRHQNDISRRCGEWWAELLYSMNYYPWDSDTVCMGWTWYLGCEMIFFVAGFALLLVYASSKRAGWVLMVGTAAASTAFVAWITAEKDLGIYIFGKPYVDYTYWIYSKPHGRIAAYIVGMAACLICPAPDPDSPGVSPRFLRRLSFAAAVSILILCGIILSVTDAFRGPDAWGTDAWGTFARVMYCAISRPVWATCCAFVFFACAYGALPRLNRMLAWQGFTPLARLTYGCYLWHPVVIKTLGGNQTSYYTYTPVLLLSRWIMNAAISYGLSFVTFLLVERPALTLVNVMLGRSKPRAEAANGRT